MIAYMHACMQHNSTESEILPGSFLRVRAAGERAAGERAAKQAEMRMQALYAVQVG